MMNYECKARIEETISYWEKRRRETAAEIDVTTSPIQKAILGGKISTIAVFLIQLYDLLEDEIPF